MRAVRGWMCEVDFDYELGEALNGTRIFESEEDLNKCRKCTTMNDKIHTSIEVVTMSKDDFIELVTKAGIDQNDIRHSNIGSIIWSKEKGKL